MNINLIPEKVRNRHKRKMRIRNWAIVFLAATVVLAIPIGWDWSREAKANRLRHRQREQAATRTTMQADWERIKNEVSRTQAQIERADALRSKRAWSSMLALITQAVPEDAWLVTVATDPAMPPIHTAKAAAASGAATQAEAASITIDAPSKINIVGYAAHAQDPITLVSSLKASGAFEDVTLTRSFLESMDDGSYFRFDIICEW